MQKNIFFSVLSIAFMAFALTTHSVNSQEPPPIQVTSFAYQNYLVVSFKHDESWHTYWKNPGSAGTPTQISFFTSTKNSKEKIPLKLEPAEWPLPTRYSDQGDLVAYGYAGHYSFFFKFPEELRNKLVSQKIYTNVEWLACKNVCVPGQKELEGSITPGKVYTQESLLDFHPSEPVLREQLNSLPRPCKLPSDLDIALVKGAKEKELSLRYHYENRDLSELNKKLGLLLPMPSPMFGFTPEKLSSTGKAEGNISIDWNGEYQERPEEFPKDGKFKKPHEISFLFISPEKNTPCVFKKAFASFTSQSALASENKEEQALTSEKQAAPPIAGTTTKNPPQSSSPKILSLLVLAFLGGLILNLMPCVLPVISLKIFGLIKNKNKTHLELVQHNLAYSFGIFISLMILASIITLLKLSGEEVGWGMQLQSPTFLVIMIIVLIVFALNLFGLFEFKTPGGKFLGKIKIPKSLIGEVFNGMLATVLSTPCSAPFLGTALGLALTSSPAMIYLVFTFIALGLSFPFWLTAISPRLVSFLPHPGEWMLHLKKVLGVTLIVTAIWLGQVLYTHIKPETQLQLTQWSIAELEKTKNEKQVAFIDFTAKWCITCKFNEKFIINSKEFQDLLTKNNVKIIIGDWTKREPVMTEWMRKHGAVAVPAYFIQGKDGTLIYLGETISTSTLQDALSRISHE